MRARKTERERMRLHSNRWEGRRSREFFVEDRLGPKLGAGLASSSFLVLSGMETEEMYVDEQAPSNFYHIALPSSNASPFVLHNS